MTNRLIRILGLCLLMGMIALPILGQDTGAPPVSTPGDGDDGVDVTVDIEATEEVGGAPTVPGAPEIGGDDIIGRSDAEAESTAEVTPEAEAAPEDGADAEIVTISECPRAVEGSYTATEQVCNSLNPGEVCLGNGTVEAQTSVPIDGFAFSTNGNRTQLVNLDALRLRTTGTPNQVWAIVRARISLNTTDSDDPVNANMVAFGDVEILDAGELTDGSQARSATVAAQFGLNVRNAPDTSGGIVYQLSPGEDVITTGITSDREWLRIQIPNRFQGTGWVYAQYMQVEGGADALPFVRQGDAPPDLTTPDFGPMQSITFRSATTPDSCETTRLDSGILLQSPGGSPGAVRFQVNDVEIQLSGTAFIQAQPGVSLQVSVIEGQATVIASGSSQTAQAGQRATISLSENLTPTGAPSLGQYNVSALEQLPTRLLRRAVSVGAGSGSSAQQGGQAQSQPQQTEPEAPAQPEQPTIDQIDEVLNEDPPAADANTDANANANAGSGQCVLVITADTVARRGPDDSFSVLTRLLAGDDPQADGLVYGNGGVVWFRLTQGGYASANTVDETDACLNLPEVDAPDPPDNASSQSNTTDVAANQADDAATNTGDASAQPSTVVTTTSGLASSELGEICPSNNVTDSGTPEEGSQLVMLGGTWNGAAGSSIRVDMQGGQLNGDLADFIQLLTDGGELLASSGNNRTLSYTFSQDQTFTLNFAAADNTLVIMGAQCTAS